jgi:dTDP-4-dehydrorhamnose reductase
LRILLTGMTGQVGSALLNTLPPLGELVALDETQLDLGSLDAVRVAVRETRPQLIVNAAAYTAVDQAEKEEALAFRVNCEAPAVLAEEAKKLGALLVHFSTDYVFDGEKPSPYVESDAPNPLNAYGRGKLAGERAIQSSGCRHLIFRTSWVYAASGKNFMLTMLRLAREGKPLRVVNDQHGAPTSNLMLAAAVPDAVRRTLADDSLGAVYHMTAAGQTTWHGFACAIFEATKMNADLSAIPSSAYSVAARRPRNSVLDNGKLAARLKVRLPSWQDGMREVLQAGGLADKSS